MESLAPTGERHPWTLALLAAATQGQLPSRPRAFRTSAISASCAATNATLSAAGPAARHAAGPPAQTHAPGARRTAPARIAVLARGEAGNPERRGVARLQLQPRLERCRRRDRIVQDRHVACEQRVRAGLGSSLIAVTMSPLAWTNCLKTGLARRYSASSLTVKVSCGSTGPPARSPTRRRITTPPYQGRDARGDQNAASG